MIGWLPLTNDYSATKTWSFGMKIKREAAWRSFGNFLQTVHHQCRRTRRNDFITAGLTDAEWTPRDAQYSSWLQVYSQPATANLLAKNVQDAIQWICGLVGNGILWWKRRSYKIMQNELRFSRKNADKIIKHSLRPRTLMRWCTVNSSIWVNVDVGLLRHVSASEWINKQIFSCNCSSQ